MDFVVGSKVIYPAHGTAEVTGAATFYLTGSLV